MRIYIAARFSRKEEMAEFGDRLKKAGHTITSTWIYGGEEGLSLAEVSDLDVADVKRADMVLSYTEPQGSYNRGGGRHTEFGIALALGKHNWIVGPREQIFHNDSYVRQFNHLDEVIAALAEYEAAGTTGSAGGHSMVGSSKSSMKKETE